MVFKIVKTEFLRDLQNSLSVFVFSVFLGFTLFFVNGVSDHLNRLFASPKWNLDLVVLPKAITPEAAIANFDKGAPDALIPMALFKTLLQQSQGSSVKILGFIPYKAADGTAAIAVTDAELKGFSELKNNSFWSGFKITDINQARSDFKPADLYQTEEWKDQVLMGMAVKGSAAEISGLKNLIDRKTVAQAFLVGENNNNSYLKLLQLENGLIAITFFIILSTLLGLLLAVKNMNAKRKVLEVVLKELKFESKLLIQVWSLQIAALIVVPILLGTLVAWFCLQQYYFSAQSLLM